MVFVRVDESRVYASVKCFGVTYIRSDIRKGKLKHCILVGQIFEVTYIRSGVCNCESKQDSLVGHIFVVTYMRSGICKGK